MTENNTSLYKGSCLCGIVTYGVDKIQNEAAHCHCTMCRKFHGAAFATYGEALLDDFRWLSGEDNLKEYLGDNDTKRFFCENCGSSLAFIPSNYTGRYIEFSLGTLDCEIPNKPDAHIFTNHSVCWNTIDDSLPQYSEGRDSDKNNKC